MTPQIIRNLWVSGSNAGGGGKTVSLALIANYLWSKGLKRTYIDADPGNKGTARAFGNFLKGQPVTPINIQYPKDLDFILRSASKSESDFLCDLPANAAATGNMEEWWHQIADATMFDELGIRLITLIPVTPNPGSRENALEYLETVGPNGTFIICLNRISYEPSRRPKEILFEEWLSVDPPKEYDIKTIEIGFLDEDSMKSLSIAQCLPSQITGVDALTSRRIKFWADNVNVQLDAIGLI